MNRRDEFALPLCAVMPEMWDAPEYRSQRHLSRFDLRRMERAAVACRTKCPRLASCLSDLATMPQPDGVIAGRIYYHGERVA